MVITKKVPGYTAVVLEGPSSVIRDAQASLKLAGMTVDSVGVNSIVLRDVYESDMGNVRAVAVSNNMEVRGAYGSKTFILHEKVQQRKAFRLNLSPNTWYFAENLEETFPFVVVRDIQIEKTGSNGDEDQILDMEFYGPDHSMPIRQTVSSRDAASYGLRPATEEDFETVDMILPVSEDSRLTLAPPSHGIPQDTPAVNERPAPDNLSSMGPQG